MKLQHVYMTKEDYEIEHKDTNWQDFMSYRCKLEPTQFLFTFLVESEIVHQTNHQGQKTEIDKGLFCDVVFSNYMNETTYKREYTRGKRRMLGKTPTLRYCMGYTKEQAGFYCFNIATCLLFDFQIMSKIYDEFLEQKEQVRHVGFFIIDKLKQYLFGLPMPIDSIAYTGKTVLTLDLK